MYQSLVQPISYKAYCWTSRTQKYFNSVVVSDPAPHFLQQTYHLDKNKSKLYGITGQMDLTDIFRLLQPKANE